MTKKRNHEQEKKIVIDKNLKLIYLSPATANEKRIC